MVENTYQKTWQEHYGEYPYSDDSKNLSPEEFSEEMLAVFETANILQMIREKKISILASSVSSGKKDFAFLGSFDTTIGAMTEHYRPEVVLTDFALTKNKKSVVQKPEDGYKNLDFHVVACDSYNLPFQDGYFDVLYERLGALYHAADEDILKKTEGALTRKMLQEYKRVLSSSGKIIIDWVNSRMIISTAEAIVGATKENTEEFFAGIGFETEFTGNNEGFIILTRSEKEVPSLKTETNDIPVFNDAEKDYTDEWGKLLQGNEIEFPTEASYANHYFDWPHIINGERREQFDCTKPDSFKFIPPKTYLIAYLNAKKRGEI